MTMPASERVRLSDIFFDEVSLVPSGDDPSAEVVIAKADPTINETSRDGGDTLTADQPIPTEDDQMPDDDTGTVIRKDDLPAEVVDYINGLEGVVASGIEAGVLDDEGNVISKADVDLGDVLVDDDGNEYVVTDKIEDDDDGSLDDFISKADPRLLSVISKAQEDAKAASDRAEAAETIAKSERDRRLKAEAISKAESMPGVSTEAEDLAELLLGLREQAPELAEKVESLLGTASNTITKSALFQEIGKAGTEVVGGEIAAKAKEIKKSSPDLTDEQALAQAYASDPAAYEAYRKEHI